MKKWRITIALAIGLPSLICSIAAIVCILAFEDEVILPVVLLGVGIVLLVVFILVARLPGPWEKNRLRENASAPWNKIVDPKKELDEVRAAFEADGDPNKNKIPFKIGDKRLTLPDVIYKGKVHYACIVQANDILFKQSYAKPSLPAVALYSPDPYYDEHPQELTEIASALFDDKPNNFLRNETTYFFNKPISGYGTNGREVYATVILVYREHLPLGCLTGQIFPIVAEPHTCTSCFMVDCKYWTKNLIADFIRGHQPHPDDLTDEKETPTAENSADDPAPKE